MSAYRPTISVHVIWHPACAEAGGYARALFAALFEDPDDLGAHGLRIPVRLWRSDGGSEPGRRAPPAVPPLDESARTIVVVMIDDQFMAAEGWLEFLDSLDAAARPQDILLGVALAEAVTEISSPLLARSFIRLAGTSHDLRQTVLINRVTHAICRLLAANDDPVRVFVSHAKSDGVAVAQAVRRFFHDGAGIEDFFDIQDLLEGSRWAAQIRGQAASNVLLAVRTDGYATREWCRTEVLEAKLGGSPVVVLDALERFEPRGFPYLGNAPSVRWSEDSPAAMEHLLGVVLHETLRFRHFPARVADLCRAYGLAAHDRILAAPPELLTVVRQRTGGDATPLVYPDPPLGTDELALVREFAPHLAMVTPTGLIARG